MPTFSAGTTCGGGAREIKLRQEQGYSVLHLGKYHGQYQFMGRLAQPLVVDSLDKAAKYAARHDKVALITYPRISYLLDPCEILYQQPLKSHRKGIAGLTQGENRPAKQTAAGDLIGVGEKLLKEPAGR